MVEVSGTVAKGYEGIRDAFAAAQAVDRGGAQLCIYRHGERVVDLWTGRDIVKDRPYSEDTLTVLMSCTKGATAVMANLLAERGLLDMEAPVAKYWPEFAANGKEGLTVGHCLSHTAGLPTLPSAACLTTSDLANWDKCVTALSAAAPLWQPGAHGSYHAVTYGYLVGEVIRRITGKTPGTFFADEIAGPLALDFWIGLPAAQQHRVAPHIPQKPADFKGLMIRAGVNSNDPVMAEIFSGFDALAGVIDFINTPEGRACELPAANGIATARALAKMYAACIGEVDGVRLLSSETVNRARKSRTKDLPQLPALAALPKAPGDGFGLGFGLTNPITKMLGAGSFGHDGAGGRLGFAHPEYGIAAGFACNSMLWDNFSPDPRWSWTVPLLEIVRSD
jgi:CubicO group peptidase (beta-lactamase class C family)